MTMQIGSRFYSSDGTDGSGQSQGDKAELAEDMLTANHLTDAKTDSKEDGGDQANIRGGDSTVDGANITLEGFSGDEE
jgi:hypothetical protein